MEHDVPTASEPLRIADNSVPMPDAKDCSSSLLADASSAGKSGDAAKPGDALKPLVACQDGKFQFSALDANGTPAKDLPVIWLDTKAVDNFRLQPNDVPGLKPYPEIATNPKLGKITPFQLDLNSPVAGIKSNSTNYYDSVARRDSELMSPNVEQFTSPTNDTVASILGLAKKFGIMPPSQTPTFGGEIGSELNGARKPGDGMPLQRSPMRRGFTIGGSTNLITNDEYSFDVGANVSMRRIPDELKPLYGSKAIEGRVEFKLKF